MRTSRIIASVGAVLALTGCQQKDDGQAEVLPTYQVDASLAGKFDVVSRLANGSFEVVVPEDRKAELQKLAPGAQIVNEDLNGPAREADPELYDVAAMERKLRDFAARFPNLVKLETYGTSANGRPEYVMTMTAPTSTSPHIVRDTPEVMITGATHGNEVITVEVVLGLMERMLNGYGTNERFTRMLDNTVIKWIPAACVDGYAARSRNVQGLDPNRDYAWPEQPNREPRTSCIQHLTSYFHTLTNPVGTMDFHAQGSMIMFPWAYTYDPIPQPDLGEMDQLTTRMAEINRFRHGSISRTIYVAKGSSADYYYWKKDTVSVAIEVSHNLAPQREEIADIVEENAESTWRFVEHFIPE